MKIQASAIANEQKIKLSIDEDDGQSCSIALEPAQLESLRKNYGNEKSPNVFLLFPLVQKTDKTARGSVSHVYPLFLLDLDREKINRQDSIEINYRRAGAIKPLATSFRSILNLDVNEIGADLSFCDLVSNLAESEAKDFAGLLYDLSAWIKKNLNRGMRLVSYADLLVYPFQNAEFGAFAGKELDFIARQDFSGKYPLLERYLQKDAGNMEDHEFRPVHGLYEKEYPLGMGQIQVLSRLREDSLIAVQGAPGTGKTTLFKSIIANRIVARAFDLMDGVDKNRSVLVVSTANTAVDNVIDDLRNDDMLGDVSWLYIRSAANKNLDSELERIGKLVEELRATEHDPGEQEKLEREIRLIKAAIDDDYDNYSRLKKQVEPVSKVLNMRCIQLYAELEIVRELSAELVDSGYFRFPHLLGRIFARGIKGKIARINAQYANRLKVFGLKKVSQSMLAELAVVEALARSGIDCDRQKRLYDGAGSDDGDDARINPASLMRWIGNNVASLKAYVDEYEGSNYADYYRRRFVSENRRLFEKSCAYLYHCMLRDKTELVLALESWAKIIGGDNEAHQVWQGRYPRFYSLIGLAYPVMASTLASAYKLATRKLKILMEEKPFDLCLCDEAGMISAHDMVPVLSRCNAAVIVGDPLQLEPVRNLSASRMHELENELFDSEEDFYRYNPESVTAYHRAAGCATGAFNDIGDGIMLEEHRRCQKPVADLFTSIAGYRGLNILTGDPEQRIQDAYRKMGSLPFVFYSVDGNTGSLKNTNMDEVEAIGQLLDKLESCGYELETDIGIITPYNNQSRLLVERYGKRLSHAYKNEKIGTVHKFQGAEFPVIVYSPVIFEPWHSAQFQNARPNMLNVAISRARQQFLVVGNHHQLLKAGGYLEQMAETVSGCHLIRMEQFTETATRITHKKTFTDIIQDCRHIKIYEEAFNRARERVIVITPWIRSSKTDWEHKIQPVKAAINRGVEVQVYYGWKNIKYGISEDGDAEIIAELKGLLGDKLIRLRNGTHEKIIVIDNRAAVIGSWNWLSHSYYEHCINENNLSRLAIRNETSVVVKDPDQIKRLVDSVIK